MKRDRHLPQCFKCCNIVHFLAGKVTIGVRKQILDIVAKDEPEEPSTKMEDSPMPEMPTVVTLPSAVESSEDNEHAEVLKLPKTPGKFLSQQK